MVVNLQEQGLNKILVFFSGFQDDTEFGGTNEFLDATFGVDFTYGDAFDFESISSWAFEYDNSSCEFSVEHRLRRRRKKRRTNSVFWFENIKKSCWYGYFTRPGVTWEITHELSSSDWFGEFRHWFRMPLSKVEDLTNILIDCGYIIPPQHSASVWSCWWCLRFKNWDQEQHFTLANHCVAYPRRRYRSFFTYSLKLWWCPKRVG